MSTINLLPLEVLHTMLNSIGSTAQRGECRLVCRRWNQAAEVIMLSKGIYLNGGDSFVKLHNHLHGKPHLVKHINRIQGTIDGSNSAPVMNLLRLAFSPKLEILSVSASTSVSDDIHDYLLDVVKNTPNVDFKLKKLSKPIDPGDRKYIDAALAFKDSLQNLYTSSFCRALTNEFGRLSVFKNLVDLQLVIETPLNFIKLESILGNCPGLESLGLEWDTISYRYDPEETANWSKKDVQQVSSLREVNLSCPMPLLTAYLVYKYPNIKKWTTHPWRYDRDQFQAAKQELPLIPEMKMRLGFEHYFDAGLAISQTSLDFSDEDITVYITFDEHVIDTAKMLIRRDQTGAHYHIRTANSVTYAEQEELLYYLWEATEDCKFLALCVDLLYRRKLEKSSASSENLTMYHFFAQALSVVRQFNFSIDRIEYKLIENKSGFERLLTDFAINYAMIDDRVFPQISDLYPNLRYLQLINCATFNGADSGDNQDKMYNINLPNSTLYALDLSSGKPYKDDTGDYQEYCLKIEKGSKINGNCYLEVSLLLLDVILYFKLNGSSKPVHMTAEDFKYRQDKDTTACISITCQQLIILIIELGDLDVKLDMGDLFMEKIEADSVASISALFDGTNQDKNSLQDIHAIKQCYAANYEAYYRYMLAFSQDKKHIRSKFGGRLK